MLNYTCLHVFHEVRHTWYQYITPYLVLVLVYHTGYQV